MEEPLDSKPGLWFKADLRRAACTAKPGGQQGRSCLHSSHFLPGTVFQAPGSHLQAFALAVSSSWDALPNTLARSPVPSQFSKPRWNAPHSLTSYHCHHPEVSSPSGPGTPKPSFIILLRTLLLFTLYVRDLLSCLSPYDRPGAP